MFRCHLDSQLSASASPLLVCRCMGKIRKIKGDKEQPR
jgi:hypothetical protein